MSLGAVVQGQRDPGDRLVESAAGPVRAVRRRAQPVVERAQHDAQVASDVRAITSANQLDRARDVQAKLVGDLVEPPIEVGAALAVLPLTDHPDVVVPGVQVKIERGIVRPQPQELDHQVPVPGVHLREHLVRPGLGLDPNADWLTRDDLGVRIDPRPEIVFLADAS